MTTLEEKQQELDALQTAFDEYIVSSRDLEDELDAEFTKSREFDILLHFVISLYAKTMEQQDTHFCLGHCEYNIPIYAYVRPLYNFMISHHQLRCYQ